MKRPDDAWIVDEHGNRLLRHNGWDVVIYSFDSRPYICSPSSEYDISADDDGLCVLGSSTNIQTTIPWRIIEEICAARAKKS